MQEQLALALAHLAISRNVHMYFKHETASIQFVQSPDPFIDPVHCFNV